MVGGQRKKSTNIAGGNANGSNDSQQASAASDQEPEAAALVTDCPDCKKGIVESSDALQCELCESWFHAECQGITKSTYKWLGKNAQCRDHNNHVHWYCRICDVSAAKVLTAVTRLSLRQDKLEREVGEQSSKIKQLDDRVASSEAKVNSIEESLKAQQEFIPKLGQSQYEGQSSHVEKGKEIVSEVTRTVNERLDRQTNVVMFNVSESNSNIKDEIMKEDMNYVKELCRYLAGEDLHYSVKRLGRRVRKQNEQDGNGEGVDRELFEPRPLLVQFRDNESKAAVMKHLYMLGEDDVPEEFSGLSVKHDMTPAEREAEKELRRKVKGMNEENQQKNIKFVIRGPPWEREVVRMEIRGKRLVPAPVPGTTVLKN